MSAPLTVPAKEISLFERLSEHVGPISNSGVPVAVNRSETEAGNRDTRELPFLYKAELRKDQAFVAGNGATIDRLHKALGEEWLGFTSVG